MSLQILRKGENTALPESVGRVQLVVTWNDPLDDRDEVDTSALLLDSTHRVRSDQDFVFYNQPVSSDGAVRVLGKTSTDEGTVQRLAIDLEALPEGVSSVAATASVDQGQFGDLNPLRLTVADGAGEPIFQYDVTDATVEKAIVLGEVYRRAGQWKVRAIGQGWSTGLAGLARDFGVVVNDEAEDDANDADDDSDNRPEHAPEEGAETQLEPGPVPPEPVAGTPVPSPAVPSAKPPVDCRAPRPRSRAVRTRRPKVLKAPEPRTTLADNDTWQPARLFSIYGVGGNNEQEQRATSALLATMVAVRPFARGIAARLGAPAGPVETYTEVSFDLGEHRLRPDGVIRTVRAGRVWTALVEVKTGSNQLSREQVEDYLTIASANSFDAVVTISNDICPCLGEHPVIADKRKLRGRSLVHLSWAEILYEARMVLAYRGVPDPSQAWLLAELIRYLEHPRSGASGLIDMGPGWARVRDAVAAGTFRASDRPGRPVAEAWLRLARSLCLRLTTELGATVSPVLPRRLAADPQARTQAVASKLAAEGTLDTALRIPGLDHPLTVVADLRANVIRVGLRIPVPPDGGSSRRRIAALTRRLGSNAPADLLVEAHFADGGETSCEKYGDVSNNPELLLPHRSAEIVAFQLNRATPMGTKRSGIRGAFIPSVTEAVNGFYRTVVATPSATDPTRADHP